MEVGIVVFPGSNCDHDCYQAVKATEGLTPRFIWHRETDLGDVGAVILPGGFSYGDYLRAGAIARFSPVMEAVIDFAREGGVVFGICNGFQVLTEVGLLPGTLRMNDSLRFICKEINLKVENQHSAVTKGTAVGSILTMPIAHKMGNYFAEEDTLKMLEDEGRVVFRYCDESGNVTPTANPNGSLHNIAGICNPEGNVVGMMPHPERRVDHYLGGIGGKAIFEALSAYLHEYAGV